MPNSSLRTFDDKDVRALTADLVKHVDGMVRADASTRALFATDASNYRHVPLVVVQPRSIESAICAVDVCNHHGVPITARGAATSTSGQACNEAAIIDCARYLTGESIIDPSRRLATVSPGTVLDALNFAADRHGLRFGPDPSTHSRCTLGGMIGNNSCGAHSIAWGKTVDSVESLDIVLYDGTRLTVGRTTDNQFDVLGRRSDRVGELYRSLKTIRDRYGDVIRSTFPVLPRRISGYNLDQLLAENGGNIARALVGTEGSCALVLGADVALVQPPAFTCLSVVGFPDVFIAADCVPQVLSAKPFALEGMDGDLVEAYQSRNRADASGLLPEGGAWLLIETGGETEQQAHAKAIAILQNLSEHSVESFAVDEPRLAHAIWRIREDGAGIATRRADGREAWPGWEDPAVPPENLGRYLREFEALLRESGLHAVTYGHFGDGCVHSRIDFDLQSRLGVSGFRHFIEEAADLVLKHGGSLSGEHGDGQARGELVSRMYPPLTMEAFSAFKGAFDPTDRMNPGGIVRPRPLDADLRIRVAPATISVSANLSLTSDNGDLSAATRRCVGVGRCLSAKGGVMCPSYRATSEERHSPRGRSHLLFEMLSGELIKGGWRSKEVRDALDLCLSCKGCKSDCPVNVDIATYKTEFLSRFYKYRLRPISHYSMGQLPKWLRLASRASRLVNVVMSSPVSGGIKRMSGIAPQRDIPKIAGRTFQREFKTSSGVSRSGQTKRVIVWPDTFTNYFEPKIGTDAVAVLRSLGYEVKVPSESVCCGLTWLSTGQIDKARKVLERSIRLVSDQLTDDTIIVGLEPSCTALLRKEATELVQTPQAERFSSRIRTLAEVLADAPSLGQVGRLHAHAIAQVHCHQHAELGFEADSELLTRLGVDLRVLDEGCCGLAGNFGFEREHYDISVQCAQSGLLPAVSETPLDTAILADGFSCRTQMRQLSQRDPLHLASFVARLLSLD